jgi:hypothetical protein
MIILIDSCFQSNAGPSNGYADYLLCISISLTVPFRELKGLGEGSRLGKGLLTVLNSSGRSPAMRCLALYDSQICDMLSLFICKHLIWVRRAYRRLRLTR